MNRTILCWLIVLVFFFLVHSRNSGRRCRSQSYVNRYLTVKSDIRPSILIWRNDVLVAVLAEERERSCLATWPSGGVKDSQGYNPPPRGSPQNHRIKRAKKSQPSTLSAGSTTKDEDPDKFAAIAPLVQHTLTLLSAYLGSRGFMFRDLAICQGVTWD